MQFRRASTAASALTARGWRCGLYAVLLVFAQLLLLAHGPHELSSDDGRSSCVVCVLGHDLGGAMCPAPAVLLSPLPESLELAPAPPASFAFPVAGYQARGPPARG